MKNELEQLEFTERFGSALETWRFHVASAWTRTTYFAFFQVGAFSGLWNIVTAHHHPVTAAFLSLAGCCLTVLWFLNGLRMHEYVTYWWERAAAIERDFGIPLERSLVQHHRTLRSRSRRTGRFGHYSVWMKAMPCVFLSAWVWMLVWSLGEVWRQVRG